MVTLRDSLVSSTARKLPVKMRSDLKAKHEIYLGRSYWVLKDPIGSRYFRLQEEEYAILKRFDGQHSLEEIKQEFEKEFPPQKIAVDDLQNFLGQLYQSGLITASTPNQGEELLKRKKKRKRRELLQKCTNILAIKFKGFDPDQLLTFLYPFVRWCFHPFVVVCCVLFCLTAALLVAVQFDTFRSKLPEFYTFFNPVNLVVLSITLGATKVIHEFGHGLVAKHFRAECHEMGFMLLVLTPCLYVNISDSWLLANKWSRIAIAFAGMYVELILASICTYIWWYSEPGLLNYLALNVMFVSSVSTVVFNINPLLRYDGYYILADYLEIPNLRQKATKILTQKCSQWFLGMEQQEDPFLPKRNQAVFAFYSVAAFGYRWVVMASILFFVYAFFKQYDLTILSHGLIAMSLFSLFILPVYKVGKFFWIPGRIYKVKAARFYLSLSGFIAVILFLAFCPLPYTVIAPTIAELRTTNSQHIYIPDLKSGCRLADVKVKAGQKVCKGEVLAILENTELMFQLADAEGRCNELAQELASLQSMRNYRSEAALQIRPTEEALKAARKLLTNIQRDAETLTMTAPIEGIVVSPSWKVYKTPPDDQFSSWWGSPLDMENHGATLESGTMFCSVGDPKKLEIVLVVEQSQMTFLKEGQRVELKMHPFPDKTFEGTIGEIEKQSVEALDIQLSTRAGGEIPTTTSAEGTEKPNRASYRVRVLFDNMDESIKVGMTGLAKVHTAPLTLGRRFWLLFNETFNFKI